MTEPFLPFARPSIDETTIAEVVDCLKSGWLTTGPRVQKFTENLKAYLKTENALVLTSATAGLQLALQALHFEKGDEVITSPLTFAASANTIVQAGAKPVFVDIDPRTYNIDVTKIESAITQKTKAIMPIHYTGLPADLDSIYALAKKYNLRVIEDAAHAIGAYYKGKILGSFGDIQVFSFHPNKNMTSGEGGCVTTNDPHVVRSVKVNSFHGIDRDAFNRFSKEGSQHYDVISAGYKYNMLDLQAAIGIHQLASLDLFIERRTVLVNRYVQLLADWKEITLPPSKTSYDCKHAWHLFAPLINPEVAGVDRDTFMTKMKEHNIGTGLHYDAVHLYSFYRNQFGYKFGDFPYTESIASRIVSLPLFPDMTEQQQDRVIMAMRIIFNK